MRCWNEYTATLAEEDHRRLVIALRAGLVEARQASTVTTWNGDADEARRSVSTALTQLMERLALLAPREQSRL